VLIPENRELLYTWDRELGCELARAYNDAVAQDLKECAHPEKYLGVAWVFLPDVEESCREIERSVKTLGLKAVKFMGGFTDANLGAEKLWPFYEKVCELDIPILVHDTASDRDGHPNPALVGIEQLYLEVDNNALPFLLAFPFRYIVDMGSLILRGALKEFPKLRVCFVEGSAAFVPWLMDRLDMDPTAKKKLGKHPREFFSQIWVSAFAAENSLKYACDYWKDHNLTVGSDYPHGDPVATWKDGTVRMIKEMDGVSETDKEKILGANAMRLFGMA
jgi:predicted TIM-barrel fold metal-dependent hydrolase